ncbi:MAG: BMP family ABC transporter substrate-binding protein [Microbacteriaceae bacterium]
MRRSRTAAIVVLAMALLAGCAAQPAASVDRIELVIVLGSPASTNDFLTDAVADARTVADHLGATLTVREATGAEAVRTEIAAAIDERPAVIIGIGDAVLDEIDAAAASSLDQQFLLLDTQAFEPTGNLSAAVFRDWETQYLLGVEAAVVAVVAENSISVAAATLDPYTAARIERFAAGVRSIDPTRSITTVIDPAALTPRPLIGGSAAFGSASTVCDGGAFDSEIRHADAALADSLRAILNGAPAAVRSYGLAEGGVGLLSWGRGLECRVTQYPRALTAVEAARDDIVAGRVVVTDPLFAE